MLKFVKSTYDYGDNMKQVGGTPMIKDYNFNEIKKYLKKDSTVGKDILEAFDTLTDAAIIFSPVVFGVQFLPLLQLLEVKNKLFELGHKVYDFIAHRVESNYIDRNEQIKAAYALICYTAYFDAFQDVLPKDVRKKLKLKLEDRKRLIEEGASAKEEQLLNVPSNIHFDIHYADHITSFSEVKEKVIVVYKNITNGLIKMIAEASVFDEEDSKDCEAWEKIKASLNDLPETAIKIYEAQYLELADQFSDFAIFAQIQNFDGMHRAIKDNKKAIELLTDATTKIDVGLNNLNEIVTSISTNFSKIQAQNIVDELKRKYVAIINEPIINDEEIKPDSEMIRLTFPKVVDAFIPQSYKCLLYQQKGIKLEDSSIWDNLTAQKDIDKFFVKYLYSLDSIDYPLIILGQPGSGKSLLTKVLSAQLMSNSYTVIRIPLRDVNADDNIDVLVEDQIKKMTNRPLSMDGYGGFASQFSEKPLIIILDGYDELLQAKGSVFSSYLEKVRTFQQDQKQLNRPVRIIVTSRITLIDKARIPINSTVLRLMEFDQKQRETWMDIWNNTNAEYFSSSGVCPFKLPEKGKKNNILELAEQPLLLLMLALYDSEANELAKTSNIRRTELYDNLLRRFIRRERSRYVVDFEDKTQEEQERIIDYEMKRLGVIAIGMYNRRDVVIHSEQLEKDLEVFKAHRSEGCQGNHPLTDAESVLGGFFFIHKSTAQDIDASSETATNAYEFLHNTFGEFLAADFILRNTIEEVKDAYIDRVFKNSETLDATLRLSPDSLKSSWYYCLMFVPLYSRPVIVEMLREHALKAFNRFKQIHNLRVNMSKEDFYENLKYIVENQLKMLLNTRNCPKEMCNGILFDNDLPLLGYLSTYSLNLIILASTLSSAGFDFFEDNYRPLEISELDLNPWDKITSLWKAWFAPADLVGLSVILKASRSNENIVNIKCNDKFEATRYEEPIDILLCLSTTLADTFLLSLAGLQTPRFQEISRYDFSAIMKILKEENYNLFVKYMLTLLRREINGFNFEDGEMHSFQHIYPNVNCLIEEVFDDQRILSINHDTKLELLELLEFCLTKKIIYFRTRRMLLEFIPRLIEDPRSKIEFLGDSSITIGSNILLQLLGQNSHFAFMSRRMLHKEFRYRRPFYGDSWADNIEEMIHFSLRRKYNDTIFVPSNKEDKSRHIRLLSAIEKASYVQSKEYLRYIEQFVLPENIDVLMETDPELPSYALLLLIKKGNYKKIATSSVIDLFFNRMYDLCESVGMGYVGFDAVINAIEIARQIKCNQFLDQMTQLLRKQLMNRSPEFFSHFVYFYPEFIERLIVCLPELFYSSISELMEAFSFERKYHYYFDGEKILSYIGAFRRIYVLVEGKGVRLELTSRDFDNFINDILEAIKENDTLFEKLTVEQMKDIIWLIGNAENAGLKQKIKNRLKKYCTLANDIKRL